MKQILRMVLPCLLLVVFVLSGCDPVGEDDFGSYSPDPISGKGANGTWTYASGYVSDLFGEWWVELRNVEPAAETDPWDFGAYEDDDDYIFFSAPSSEDERKLQFSFDGDTSDQQTVTYYVNETNYIFSEGFLTLTVDEEAGEALVKLDIRGDDYHFNGTVTVPVEP